MKEVRGVSTRVKRQKLIGGEAGEIGKEFVGLDMPDKEVCLVHNNNRKLLSQWCHD